MESGLLIIRSFVLVSGALVLFVYGMLKISSASLGISGQLVGRLLEGVGRNPFPAFFRGFVVGLCVVTPSSGVFLLTSMAATGSIAQAKTPYLMAGILCGSSFYAWILAFGGFILPFPYFGLFLLALSLPAVSGYWDDAKGRSSVLFGSAISFTALHFLRDSSFWDAFGQITIPLSVILISGILCTVLFRSVFAVIILAITLLVNSVISSGHALLLLAGVYPGLSLLLYLLARSLGQKARQSAFLHLFLNMGALLVMLVISVVCQYRNYEFSASRLALLYILAYCVGNLLVFPWLGFLLKLAFVIYPDTTDDQDSLHIIPHGIPEALEANLLQTKQGLAVMAGLCSEMLMIVMNTSQGDAKADDACNRVALRKEELGVLRGEISRALSACMEKTLTRTQAETVQKQQRIAHELKGIGDDCIRIMRVFHKGDRKEYRFHQESDFELFGYTAQVLDFLHYNRDYLHGRIDVFDIELARKMEEGIDAARDSLKKKARRILEKDQEAQVRGELAFIEIISHLERIGDSCLQISAQVSGI